MKDPDAGPLKRAIIIVDGISVRLRERWLLGGLSWRIHLGEHWVVTGPNGAGKTTLAKAIAGQLPVVQGKIHYPGFGDLIPYQAIAYVASDARREIWRQEQRLAHGRDFAGRITETTPVIALLRGSPEDACPPTAHFDEPLAQVVRCCNLNDLLEKPVMAISTGEMARVLIGRELLHQPLMLILDEPFEGLDGPGRQALIVMLDRLAGSGLTLLLINHRQDELPAAITHRLTLDEGRIVESGPLPPDLALTFCDPPHPCDRQPAHPNVAGAPRFPGNAGRSSPPLIDMRSVTVRYGTQVVLDRLNWSVRTGQHWAVTGPNGAGKSTLLKLVTGDCLQVYANAIRLFGRERGPSQTLDDTRRRLGVVSHDLAAGYQKQVSALDVVCSGFFDSVGLYRRPAAVQLASVHHWLQRMGLASLAAIPFNQLSQGQRQMILIARAMIKSPPLLILDEPLAGLDIRNRKRVQALLDDIGEKGETTLIVVSHHWQEIPRCTTHQLVLDQGQVVYSGPVVRGDADQPPDFSAALRPSS